MRLKLMILISIVGLFIGCSEEVHKSSNTQSSSITPQPSVEDESVRPPKPPSI